MTAEVLGIALLLIALVALLRQERGATPHPRERRRSGW